MYIDYNYGDSNYTLPSCDDFELNICHIELELGFESTFLYFDNETWSFQFYNTTIIPEWRGIYRVKVNLWDDNWLGPKS